MKAEQAQKIAERLQKFDGVSEVVWLMVANRMIEFYIVAESKQKALWLKNDIENLARENPASRFAVMPKDSLSWGYTASRQ